MSFLVCRLMGLLCFASWPCLAGCEVLNDFDGRYAGSVIKGEFVRSCFPPDARAELNFDPNQILTSDPRVNTLAIEGVFEAAPLRPVRGLANDQLGNYDFPGPSRVRNYIMLVRPQDGPLMGRDATVFISLLEVGEVELRVLASTGDGGTGCLDPDPVASSEGQAPGEPEAYFGVFILRKDS